MTPRQIVDFRVLLPHQKEAINALAQNDWTSCSPAVVSMPTGTGKTAVVAMAPFVLKANRVLLIAPDLALFKQLSDELMGSKEDVFKATLYRIGALPRNVLLPSVQRVTSTQEVNQREFLSRDLVLANADKFHTLKNSTWQNSLPSSLFDVVIIDEAHHLPSNKWKTIVDHFGSSSKVIFVTATPYRADGVSVCTSFPKGRIIFHYKLEDALRE